MTGAFPSVLKTAKLVPITQSPCYQILKKILEKLMYKRLHTFLNKNVIYNLQFGFRQQYSISHALINITENIRKALDNGNTGCGVFVDLQKAFDTVDHQVLLAKLNHCGICGVLNVSNPICLVTISMYL